MKDSTFRHIGRVLFYANLLMSLSMLGAYVVLAGTDMWMFTAGVFNALVAYQLREYA